LRAGIQIGLILAAFFTDARKRNGIPPPVVHPFALDVKACIFKKNANGLLQCDNSMSAEGRCCSLAPLPA
jgi:hypothetical protein